MSGMLAGQDCVVAVGQEGVLLSRGRPYDMSSAAVHSLDERSIVAPLLGIPRPRWRVFFFYCAFCILSQWIRKRLFTLTASRAPRRCVPFLNAEPTAAAVLGVDQRDVLVSGSLTARGPGHGGARRQGGLYGVADGMRHPGAPSY